MGDAWTNQVYQKPYTYKGCYKDSAYRMVPTFIQNVNSVEDCKNLAIKYKFDTFALQYRGFCFVGNAPNYAKLGIENNIHNCPTLGGDWSN